MKLTLLLCQEWKLLRFQEPQNSLKMKQYWRYCDRSRLTSDSLNLLLSQSQIKVRKIDFWHMHARLCKKTLDVFTAKSLMAALGVGNVRTLWQWCAYEPAEGHASLESFLLFVFFPSCSFLALAFLPVLPFSFSLSFLPAQLKQPWTPSLLNTNSLCSLGLHHSAA